MPKISEKSKSQPVTRMRTKQFVCVGCRGCFPSLDYDAHTNRCEPAKRVAEEREKRKRDMDGIRARILASDDDDEAPASASASASVAHAHGDDSDTADTAAPLRTSAVAAKISAKSKSKFQTKTKKGKQKCPLCLGSFPAQNFRAHVKKCDGEIVGGFSEYGRELIEKARADLAARKDPDDDDDDDEEDASDDDTQAGDASSLVREFTNNLVRINERSSLSERYPLVGIVENSPSSQPYPHIPHMFEAYRSGAAPAHRPSSSSQRPPRHSDSDDPWWQQCFETREDFLLAELLLEIDMSQEQTDRLMEIIGRCVAGGEGTCTLESYADVKAAWDRAGMIGPGVRVYERTDDDYFLGEECERPF